MSVKSKVERLERRAPKAPPAGEECGACAALRNSMSRAYGFEVEPFIGCAPAKCGEVHRGILKVYGGDDGDGLKAAA